jgi:hypothetical protein
METNLNYWGYLAVIAGVLLCFGPAVFLWLKAEFNERDPAEGEQPGVAHGIKRPLN